MGVAILYSVDPSIYPSVTKLVTQECSIKVLLEVYLGYLCATHIVIWCFVLTTKNALICG